MHDTLTRLRGGQFPAITRTHIETLQLNLGYLCNLSCIHCHVNAGPRRTELMSRQTMQTALDVAEHLGVKCFDLTGGSPEMNPEFRWLVSTARQRGIAVMDRLNPTIIEEPGYDWVAEFLAAHAVEVVASLPCYSAKNVDEQRGDGVFESSIRALQKLNALGYAKPGSGLVLNLVYNPNGAFLPPPQAALEADYKRLLSDEFSIEFNQLFALANMPIKRFGSWLVSKGKFDDYMNTLENAHSEANLASVMCRSLISVDWTGRLYDCDFNQMLELPCRDDSGAMRIEDLLERDWPRRIAVARHCFGCTAGQGSSCGGALNAAKQAPVELQPKRDVA